MLGLSLNLGLGASGGGGTPWEEFTAPAGFLGIWDYTSTFAIEQSGRNFRSTFDAAVYAAPAGVTVYVDPVNGASGNNGLSSGAAKDTLQNALDITNASVVVLAPGYYDRAKTWGTSGPALYRNTALLCPTGRAIFAMANASYTWSKTGGRTNVYQATTNTAEIVADHTNLDSEGFPTPLVNVGSVATCDSTPNSWYHDGTVLYVHTFDARSPGSSSSNPIVAFRNNLVGFEIEGNYEFYFKSIDLWGGRDGALFYTTTNGTAAKVIAEDCTFAYSDQGFTADDLDFAYARNCKAKYNKLDGFSINSATTQTKAVFENCRGTMCGLDSFLGAGQDDFDDNCNAFTAHDSSVMIVLNGYGDKTDGPIIAQVGTSTSLILGTYAGESYATTQGAGGADVSYKVAAGTTMWMENCESGPSYDGRQNTGTLYDLGGYIDGSQNGDDGTIS